MPTTEDRRVRIADAVIATLAERGSRGLTHRAVDEAAGLPTGSTSYYLRSRAELLASAVPRLAELDAQGLRGTQGSTVAAVLKEVVRRSLGEGRERTLARYELTLEAARRPELQTALAEGTTGLLAMLDVLRGQQGEDDQAWARDTLAFIDGLLLSDLTSPDQERRQAAERDAAIDRFLGDVGLQEV